jgi:hypothetical protein
MASAPSSSAAPSSPPMRLKWARSRSSGTRFQREGLAARADGDRHLAQLSGGEDEGDGRRRLLQRLEQGVEGLLRQHVDLVQDEHLLAALGGAEAQRLAQLANVVDAAVGGGVHLHHVRVAVGEDRLAFGADAAGIGRGAARAVGPTQFRARAMMRAVVVLPTPRTPVSRKA